MAGASGASRRSAGLHHRDASGVGHGAGLGISVSAQAWRTQHTCRRQWQPDHWY